MYEHLLQCGRGNLNWSEGSDLQVRAPLCTWICKRMVQESGAESGGMR